MRKLDYYGSGSDPAGMSFLRVLAMVATAVAVAAAVSIPVLGFVASKNLEEAIVGKKADLAEKILAQEEITDSDREWLTGIIKGENK